MRERAEKRRRALTARTGAAGGHQDRVRAKRRWPWAAAEGDVEEAQRGSGAAAGQAARRARARTCPAVSRMLTTTLGGAPLALALANLSTCSSRTAVGGGAAAAERRRSEEALAAVWRGLWPLTTLMLQGF